MHALEDGEVFRNLPEDECSKNLQGNGVGLECSRCLQRVSILIVKSPAARAKDNSSNKGCGSSSHVDNTRSSKVNDTNATEVVTVVGAESGEESSSTPDGASDDGVDETSKED